MDKIPSINDGEHTQKVFEHLDKIQLEREAVLRSPEIKLTRAGRFADIINQGYMAEDNTEEKARGEKLRRRLMGVPKFRDSILAKKTSSDVVVYDPNAPKKNLRRESNAGATEERAHLEAALEKARNNKKTILDISIENFKRDKGRMEELVTSVQSSKITSEAAAKLALEIINTEDLANFINDLKEARTEVVRRLRSPTVFVDDVEELNRLQKTINDTLIECESMSKALLKIRPVSNKSFKADEIGSLIRTTEEGMHRFRATNPDISSELKKAVIGANNDELVRSLKVGLYPIYFDLKDYIRAYKAELLTNPSTSRLVSCIDSDQRHTRDGFWSAVSQLQNPNQRIEMNPNIRRLVDDLDSDNRHRLLALADLMELSREIKMEFDFSKINELAKNLPKRNFNGRLRSKPEERKSYRRRGDEAYKSGERGGESKEPTINKPLQIAFNAGAALAGLEDLDV